MGVGILGSVFLKFIVIIILQDSAYALFRVLNMYFQSFCLVKDC